MISAEVQPWPKLDDAVAALRAKALDMGQFLRGQLESLDALEAELADRADDLIRQQSQLDEREQAAQQAAAALAAQRELLEAQERELAGRQEAAQAEAVAELHARLAEATDALEIERGRIHDTSAELSQARQALRDALAARDEAASAARSWQQQCDERETARQAGERGLLKKLAQVETQRDARLAELSSQLCQVAADRDSLHDIAEQLRQERDSRAAECEALTEQLTEACQQRNQWQTAAGELEEECQQAETDRADLDRARRTIADLETALDEASQRWSQLDATPWQTQIGELEQEREVLEVELEKLRRRLAEVAENAASERRRIIDERTEWATELKMLRRALESSNSTASPPVVGADAGPSNGSTAAQADGKQRPVVDAVMAQFERLQQDRLRRRANNRPGKQEVA